MMAELDLLTEESRFRALMENTEDSIYFKDRECRLLGVSRRMAVNLGFDPRPVQLVGKTDVDLFGETFGRRTLMEDLRIMESGEPVIGVVESRSLEGSALESDLDDQGADPRRLGQRHRPHGDHARDQ